MSVYLKKKLITEFANNLRKRSIGLKTVEKFWYDLPNQRIYFSSTHLNLDFNMSVFNSYDNLWFVLFVCLASDARYLLKLLVMKWKHYIFLYASLIEILGCSGSFFLSGKFQSQSKNIFESMSLICLWYNRLTLVAPEYDETYWALTNANKKFMNDFQNLSQALSLPDFDRFKANEILSVCCFIIAIKLQTVEWWSVKVIFLAFYWWKRRDCLTLNHWKLSHNDLECLTHLRLNQVTLWNEES